MMFKVTAFAAAHGEGVTAEVVGGVVVEVILVPPGLFRREVELEGCHRVDVEERGDGVLHGGEGGGGGADKGRLRGVDGDCHG